MNLISKKHKISYSGVCSYFLKFKILRRKDLIITSDTFTNILISFSGKKQILILNGLGRYERKFSFRYLLVYLFNRKYDLCLIVQNYRDYRYFRRFLNKEINWIPGSGGVYRQKGFQKDPIIVSRDRKFYTQYQNLQSLLDNFEKVIIVGLQKTKIDNPKLINVGRVSQANIFREARSLLQVDGYGEGVPHSLLDAICSDMSVYLSKASWINFGFYRLAQKLKPKSNVVNSNLIFLESGSHTMSVLKSKLNIRVINEAYSKIILDNI